MGFYICDWNINGWNSKKAYDAGRLMKLSYTGKSLADAQAQRGTSPRRWARPFEATTQELIAGLAHPAQSVRLVASRRIGERGAEAVAPLVALLNDSSASKEARWSAIWTLDRIDDGKAGRDAIIALLTNPQVDVSIRMQAARQLGTRKAHEAVAPADRRTQGLRRRHALRAATALGRIGDAQAVPLLIDKLTEKDLFARFAVFTALNRIGRHRPTAWEQRSSSALSVRQTRHPPRAPSSRCATPTTSRSSAPSPTTPPTPPNPVAAAPPPSRRSRR